MSQRRAPATGRLFSEAVRYGLQLELTANCMRAAAGALKIIPPRGNIWEKGLYDDSASRLATLCFKMLPRRRGWYHANDAGRNIAVHSTVAAEYVEDQRYFGDESFC